MNNERAEVPGHHNLEQANLVIRCDRCDRDLFAIGSSHMDERIGWLAGLTRLTIQCEICHTYVEMDVESLGLISGRGLPASRSN